MSRMNRRVFLCVSFTLSSVKLELGKSSYYYSNNTFSSVNVGRLTLACSFPALPAVHFL